MGLLKETTIFLFLILFLDMNEGKLFKLRVLHKPPVCEVEDRFLSVALSIGQAERDFKILDYSSQKLKTLLSALKPAYFRFGGSAANFLFFKVGSTKPTIPPSFPDKIKTTANNKPATINLQTTKSPQVTPKILHGDSKEENNAKPTESANTQPPNLTPFTPNIPQNPTDNQNQSQPNGGQIIQATNPPPTLTTPGINQPNQPGLDQQNPPGPNQQNPANSWPNTPNKNKSPFRSEDDEGDENMTEDDDDDDNVRKNEMFSASGEGENDDNDDNTVNADDSSNDDSADKYDNADYNDNVDDNVQKGGNTEKRDLIKRGKIAEPFWLMSDDFDKFYNFVNDAGLDLIFNLGQFVRYENGSWNSSNALDFLHHIAYRQFKIGLQLGNEPNSYKKYGDERVISGKQDGEDLVALRKIMRSNPKFGTLVLGPDITRPRQDSSAEKFLRDYLKTDAKSEVSAVSWHQYYVNGRTTTEEEMVDPETLDLLKDQMNRVNKVMMDTDTKKPVWLTETGSAWGGGAEGLSDTFAASFMYLDKLGLAGVFCHSVVMRQSFLSGKYAMLDDDYTPRPDYWLALLHKGLVGKKVLLVSGDTKSLRAYTHCTKESAQYPKGAITVMIMNLRLKPARISFKGKLAKLSVEQFLMTSSDGSLTTKEVMLNGRKLKLGTDNSLPDLAALKVKQPMKMPSYSYGFYVIPDANMQQCK